MHSKTGTSAPPRLFGFGRGWSLSSTLSFLGLDHFSGKQQIWVLFLASPRIQREDKLIERPHPFFVFALGGSDQRRQVSC